MIKEPIITINGRVLMEAMREPTDAMVEAALDNAHNTATVYRDAWRHMVDAALKEADPE